MAQMSQGESQSQGTSESKTSVWGDQSPFLNDLYQQAQAQFQGFNPNQDLYQQGQQGIGNLLQGQGNPNMQSYANQFQNQLGQLNQQTGGQAGLGGVYGGARQGILESQNQQNIGDQMGRFYGDQYAGDQNRMLGAIQALPGQLQLDPYQQQAGALSNYAQALGGPTILAESYSNNSSESKDGGMGIG